MSLLHPSQSQSAASCFLLILCCSRIQKTKYTSKNREHSFFQVVFPRVFSSKVWDQISRVVEEYFFTHILNVAANRFIDLTYFSGKSVVEKHSKNARWRLQIDLIFTSHDLIHPTFSRSLLCEVIFRFLFVFCSLRCRTWWFWFNALWSIDFVLK